MNNNTLEEKKTIHHQEITALKAAIPIGIPDILPPKKWSNRQNHFKGNTDFAPNRNLVELSLAEKKLAIKNALRYFPIKHHAELAPEFADELKEYGRIYMYRFRPTNYGIKSYALTDYPVKSRQAAAIMLMIHNNLDENIAKHPLELITYGGNGAVFQNWGQYLLTMQYLSEMSNEQTLVLYSGHPLGLFPSNENAPRLVITNGMMIPNYSRVLNENGQFEKTWNKYNAIGVTQYGQMTAGSFMYIGPQGIVHGTTITVLNAGRKVNIIQDNKLKGKLFITSGLGGMSGAQAKAAVITGVIGIIAEIDPSAIDQRINDRYIEAKNVFDDLDKLLERIQSAQADEEAVALVYQGNVVDLWEKMVAENVAVHLGSDQTSLHNIDDCGYTPVGYSFEAAKDLAKNKPATFLKEVKKTLCRHVEAINHLTEKGMYFFDYGNAFLLEAGRAGANIWQDNTKKNYRYSSYVEDIMGPICFDYGFGPFRWVCTSGTQADLAMTDKIAAEVLQKLLKDAPDDIKGQLADNLTWIQNAHEAIPNVGSKSRILYADADGRSQIAQAFNEAIQSGKITAPIVLGRDHHDVSGTDSPYRETSDIRDGSKFTADMSVQNVIGDAFRGATWVSLHNGGGVGWGEVMNGGFGLVLDGSESAAKKAANMLFWDVNNGIARRSWARNPHAKWTIQRAMAANPNLKVTLSNEVADEQLLEDLF